MVTVSVSELKAKLSEHIRRVQGGEQIVVTDRGRAVATLGPARQSEELDPGFQELADAGLVKPGRGPIPPEFWDMPAGEDPRGSVLAALIEEREEGP